jgi:hypothetical protein
LDKFGNLVINLDRHLDYYYGTPNPAGIDKSVIYLRFADVTRGGRGLWKKVTLSNVNSWPHEVKLRYGDVDGNNVIDIVQSGNTDYTYWALRDGAEVKMNHTNSTVTSTYKYDIAADLNRDGIVSDADRLLLNSCFGTANQGDMLNQ